jgi:hypothetical protein
MPLTGRPGFRLVLRHPLDLTWVVLKRVLFAAAAARRSI